MGKFFRIDGLIALASHCDVDIVVNGLVGSVGLRPTLAALEAGKIVAIANKTDSDGWFAHYGDGSQNMGVKFCPLIVNECNLAMLTR